MGMPFKNPIKDSIPCFLFTDAIYRGKEMTDISDGVRGTTQLKQNINLFSIQQEIALQISTAPLKKCMIF
ncbi:hypothetical protein ACLWXS_001372 [Campylobacter jejuni]